MGWLVFSAVPVFVRGDQIKLRVIVPNAAVRLRPSSESEVVKILEIGALLDSSGKTGDWYRVSLPPDQKGISLSGYVNKEDVEVYPWSGEAPAGLPQKPPPAAAETGSATLPSNKIRLGFKASGGLNYNIFGGDVGTGLIDMTKALSNMADRTTGEFDIFRWGKNAAAEIILDLSRNFGLTFGAGFLSYEKAGGIEYVLGDAPAYHDSITTKLTLYPVILGLRFRLTGSHWVEKAFDISVRDTPSRLSAHFSLGIGYFGGRFRLEESYANEIGVGNSRFDARIKSVGIIADGNLEFSLSRDIFLCIDITSRIARFPSLIGKYVNRGSSIYGAIDEDKEATLWAFDLFDYAWISVSDVEPSGDYIQNVRKAELWVVSMGIQVGILIRI